MASENPSTASGHGHFAQDEHYEQQQLLSYDESPRDASPDSDIVVDTANKSHSHSQSQSPRPGAFLPRRQSSFAQPRPAGTPRTTNRVHFDVEDSVRGSLDNASHHDHDLMEEEDYLTADNWSSRRHNAGQRAPLLTNIEAPSVTVAESDFNPDDLLESARPKSSMSSAFMNMANSIIGAGIIGQPYALRQAGLLTGVVLLIVLTITVDWTIRLIVTNSKLSGTNSFQATVEHCYGKSGLVAISIAQWAFAFGGMIAFCIIVGDTIPHVMSALFPSLEDSHFLWLLTDRKFVIVVFIMGISYPFSLYRDISKVGRSSPSVHVTLLMNMQLAKASSLALFSMLIIVITVITQGPSVPAEMKGPIKGSLIINNGVFQAIGVISFGTCLSLLLHDHNSLLIYGSLQKPTMDRFAKVTHYSTSISMLACLAMALSGYLNFGSLTQGNVLNNFPTNNMLVNIARLCFGLNMLTTLPLEAFVCREVMNLYYFSHEPFDPNRHLILTTALVISAMGLSLLTCDLGIVFELVGATSACALAYILPPLCYVKLTQRRTWETYAAYVCIAFGCVVMGISVLLAGAKMVKGEGGAQTC
ncbi:putative amino acid transporter [Aureobasidium subglaciale]|nr:putative amino acid transporter [Aureobasidium subglaciale]KAI5231188.1 putative amino acid transporter [Aureobasidium subglaciale]KAI5234178.1 putative amino acid transporter [Aureobasidium subglaciale]KAI5267509.1 putative amino acid transporter [Aureobasidium subglaciale]